MGLSGVSGPFRGAYLTIPIKYAPNLSIGALNAEIGRYNIPAGMEVIVWRVTASATDSGSQGDAANVGRVTVKSGQTEIATQIALASNSMTTGTLVAALATAPGGIGIPVLGNTDLVATASALTTNRTVKDITVYIDCFVRRHPNSVRTVYDVGQE